MWEEEKKGDGIVFVMAHHCLYLVLTSDRCHRH